MSSHTSSPASPSSPRKISKAKAKDPDWADVTDPEQRRRIQNRIAQRKFREKARESREKAERDARNLEHAGNSYRIPGGAADVLGDSGAPSGLPWGGVHLGHVVARGHEAESRRGRHTHAGDDSSNPSSNGYSLTAASYGGGGGQPVMPQVVVGYGAVGGGGGEDQVMDDSPYLYCIGSPPMPAFFTG
ncbi:hypothetical protein ISF_02122 [Cordyceps fumosorosea ARSEF 2679]|uniref:BZIP domain-containing protein n=1 Tax=Cordyceps fumosorosea (strain ARSEF 2679) TaxID=1081104 RepID=A0A168CMV6_CORFA|nr:hypothetical protein ISF_02122 [Cordyceps fumosorosea ARSEF 2679]OAA71571.1 hypothetical protein ISF_02122 [Cordyceps fumosorosea ARSEF 2679]